MSNVVSIKGESLKNDLNSKNYDDELTKYVVSDLDKIIPALDALETAVDDVQNAVNDKIREIAEREARLAAERKAREEELARSQQEDN